MIRSSSPPIEMIAALRASWHKAILLGRVRHLPGNHPSSGETSGTWNAAGSPAVSTRNWYRGLGKMVLNPPPEPHRVCFAHANDSIGLTWNSSSTRRSKDWRSHSPMMASSITWRRGSLKVCSPTPVTFRIKSARTSTPANRCSLVPVVGLLAKAAETHPNAPVIRQSLPAECDALGIALAGTERGTNIQVKSTPPL